MVAEATRAAADDKLFMPFSSETERGRSFDTRDTPQVLIASLFSGPLSLSGSRNDDNNIMLSPEQQSLFLPFRGLSLSELLLLQQQQR